MAKKKPATAGEELATLAGNPREVTVGGEKVKVRALTILEIGALIENIEPLIGAYDGSASLIQLLSKHASEIVLLAAATTDRDVAWVAKLPAGDFLALGVAAIEVNAGFFVMMLAMGKGPSGVLPIGAGPTPSSSLPATASTQ